MTRYTGIWAMALAAAIPLGYAQPASASMNISAAVCRAIPTEDLAMFAGEGFKNYTGETITVFCPLSFATGTADTAVVRIDGNNPTAEALKCTLYSHNATGDRLAKTEMTAEPRQRFSTTIRIAGAAPANAYLTVMCTMPWQSIVYGFSVR